MKRRILTGFLRIIAGICILANAYDYTAGIAPQSVSSIDTLGFSLFQDNLPVTNATFGDEPSASDETIILGAGLIPPAQPEDSEPITPSEYARYSQAAAPRLLQGFKLPQALNGGIASFSRTLRIADTVFVMGPHHADGSDMSVFTTIPIDELSLALIDSAPFAFADVAHIPVIAYALPSRNPRYASITLIDTKTSQISTLRIPPTTNAAPADTLVSQLAFSSHTDPQTIKLAALFTSTTQSYVHVFTITRDENDEISIGQGKSINAALPPAQKDEGARYSMSWTPDGRKLIVLTKKPLTQAQKSTMPGDTSASISAYDGTSLRLLTPTPLEFSYIHGDSLDGVVQATNDLTRLLVDHYRIIAPDSFARAGLMEQALGRSNITRQLEQRRQTGRIPYRPIKQ